ncbi:hypothetical protein BV20DRAFT_1057869 [Pilatotrama ljubarskyi]|nr:hypothetical protein BV20DRAFT_1057869 [Pilatotrama ljubarskyi]
MAFFIFAHVSLGGTLGVTFLGSSVSSMLYGVTCLQTITYFRSRKAKMDGFGLRLLVGYVLALPHYPSRTVSDLYMFFTPGAPLIGYFVLRLFDSAHQAVVIHICYNYLVLAVKDPLKLSLLVWSVPGALSLANLGTNISYGVRGYQYKGLFDAEVMLRPHGIAGLSTSVACELMISTSLAYYLYTRRTGLRRSKDIVNRLIALTITTGMLTTVFDVIDLIAYTTAHDNLYVMFFNFLLAKLYANALLTA